MAVYFLLQSFIAPMRPVILTAVTPGAYRGQLIALTMVIAVMFAWTVGPTLVGILNDFVLRQASIHRSLSLVNLFFPILAKSCLVIGWLRFNRAIAAAEGRGDGALPL